MSTLSKVCLNGVLAFAVIFGLSPFIQSCEPEDVAVGAAVVAGTAAVIAVTDNDGHHGHDSSHGHGPSHPGPSHPGPSHPGPSHGHVTPHHGHYRSSNGMYCYTYENYWGETKTVCKYNPIRSTIGDAYRSRSANLSEIADTFKKVPMDQVLSPAEVGSAFYMSESSAQLFLEAMKEAQHGNLDKINALGLTNDDMNKLAKLQLPPDESINRLAKNLDQSLVLAKGMLSKIIVTGYKLRDLECENYKTQPGQSKLGGYKHWCENK